MRKKEDKHTLFCEDTKNAVHKRLTADREVFNELIQPFLLVHCKRRDLSTPGIVTAGLIECWVDTQTHTDIQTHIHRHRHTDTQTQTDTGTDTHRHTDTQTHTDTHIHAPCHEMNVPLGSCCEESHA
jgi:hypothetical protein